MEAVRSLGSLQSALAKPSQLENQNTRTGWRGAGAAICEWTVWMMTWRKRAHVSTSGECGPPVVQVMARGAPGWDSDCARQSPQARRCGERGDDELYYSQRLCAPGRAASQRRGWKKSKPDERLGVMRAHTSGETFRCGSTQRRTVRLDKA